MKTKTTKLLSLLFALAMLVTTLTGFSTVSYAATKSLNKTSLTVCVGTTYKLKLKNASGTVKWSSSAKSACKVSSSGKITALKNGTAKIKAKKQGQNIHLHR